MHILNRANKNNEIKVKIYKQIIVTLCVLHDCADGYLDTNCNKFYFNI